MIIAGLGNPGQKYESSRHNIGFMAVDVVARDMRTSFGKIAYGSLIANFSFKGENHLLAKPQTFMNLSGESVGPLLSSQTLPSSDLLVIADDINLPLGSVRLRSSGGAGGHHGLESIIEFVGENFWRLRIGIGKIGLAGLDQFVLGQIDEGEKEILFQIFQDIPELVRLLLLGFGGKAMGKFNGRKYAPANLPEGKKDRPD